jgi:sporulation protein YlmC with PRC-barrel domain
MTRLSATAVAALLVLGSGAAWAQTSPSSPPTPGTMTQSTSHSAAPSSMKNPLMSEDISQINGTSVAGSDGGSIGKVSTVLMDPSSKKVNRLVVAEGGVLGVGSHLVALPVDSFKWDAQNHNFVVQKTADDLKAMPEWQKPQLAEAPAAGMPAVNPAAGAAAAGGMPAAPIPPDAPNAVTPAH